MMQEVSGIDELLSKSPILQKALDASHKNAIRPRELLRKLGAILGVFVVGSLGLVLTLLSIRWRVFHGSQQQALAAMLVLLSGAVVLFSVIGGFFTLWNAFVSTYMELQGSRVETAEVSDQCQVLVESIAAPVERGRAAVVGSTYPLNESLVEAVAAIVRVAPSETARMVTVVRQAAEGSVSATAAHVAALIRERD